MDSKADLIARLGHDLRAMRHKLAQAQTDLGRARAQVADCLGYQVVLCDGWKAAMAENQRLRKEVLDLEAQLREPCEDCARQEQEAAPPAPPF